MDKLSGMTGPAADVAQSVGKLIDKAVPFGVGIRTQVAVLACPLLGYFVPLLANVPGAGPFMPLLTAIRHFLCATTVAFAYAGLVRPKSAS